MPVTPCTIRPITPADAYPLRHAVLWPNKPPAYVQLPDDEAGHHFGAFLEDGKLAAVISLFVTAGEARFRKFAALPQYQGQGLGTALLRYVIAEATRLGARTLWCDSRQAAAGFYRRFGMAPHGDGFCKGDVPYVRMRLADLPGRD